MSVAERLVRARGDRRREDVANAVGVSVSAIAMYENGGRVPRDETKIKLADFYGMTVQALFLIDKCHITCLPKKARRNERAQAQAHERSTPMKTIDDYKEALEHAGSAVQEKLLAQADADGFTAWELAELVAWAEAWAYGNRWLQALAAIVIDPARCPETAKEFSEYEYQRDPKTNEVLEGYPDAANHSIDAVRYATEPIWRRRGQ